MFDDDKRTPTAHLFDPASSIADSWTLDGEGWEWVFREYVEENGTGKNVLSVETWVLLPSERYDANLTRVYFADFLTKPDAYAVARCRAWLKAKTAEREANR